MRDSFLHHNFFKDIYTNMYNSHPSLLIFMLSIDHPGVQDVLEIAEEISNENNFLDIHKIYQRAKRNEK